MSDTLIDAIDAEIEKLQKVRVLLAQTGKAELKAAKVLKSGAKAKVHTMSAEGRARIAAAQKKRWAAKRKADKKAAAEAEAK